MRLHHAITLLALSSATALAQMPPAAGARPPATPARGPSMELALEAAQTAVNLCHSQGHDVSIVVADSAGGIKVALVPDSKVSATATRALSKIALALEFKQNSADVVALAKTDKAVADKIAANSSFFASPGAVLIKVGDEIIGAIAGSGGKPDEDAACAQAGLDKVQARVK